MQIWIHDNKMQKIVALNNDIPDMLSYTNSSWHPYLDQATSTFDFTIPKFSNGELHEDLKLINDECFVSFYVNGSYQVFYIATLQEDDFNIQLTCNNTNLEYALEYANPFSSDGAQTIEWYLNNMELLSFASVEIGINEISDRKRTLTFDSQETKMNRLQSLMSNFDAEFEFKTELNRDGTYKRIVINIYQEADDTHHGIGSDRKDVVLYYSNGLKGVQVSSDKTQMFNAGVFTGKDGLNLADVEFSEKNSDGVEEFYSRKGSLYTYAPLSRERYPSTMQPGNSDNWTRKDFTTEYENVNDLKAYALRTLKKYAYPLVTYTASVQSGFVSHYTDLKLGDTIRIIDKNFLGGLALEARVSEMIISFDNPANNSFVFTNYRKLDNKPTSALQTRIDQAVESKLPYRIELATTGGVTFKNNEGETTVKPSLYKGNLPYTTDVTWRWALDGVVTVGMQYRIQAKDITDTAVLTVSAYVGNNEVATTEITLTDVNDGDDGVGVESIDRYFTSSDQSDGVTIEGAEWSDKPPAPTEDGKYLWAYDEITYTDGTVTTTKPAAVGANFDVDAFRAEIAEDLKDVPNREEFENKIAEELATSKAEITTQIETAKTQAESNAKEYADTINEETAKVAELANAAAGEIKADLVNVKNNLTSTSIVANNAQAAVDAAKQDLTNSVAEVNTKVDNAKEELTQAKQQLTTVADDLSQAKTDLQSAVSEVDTKATNLKNDLSQAKQDLASQAQQLQAQASAQTELTNRVSSVEKTANGTKTTVNELSKSVAQNGKDITSVTARTKVVEDDLTSTKTTLSQVKTTADSTSQKTATLETGLDGLSAKFDSLKIGGRNLLTKTNQGKTNWSWNISSGGTTAEDYNVDGVNAVKLTRTSDATASWDYIQYQGLIRKLIEPDTEYTLSFDVKPNVDVIFGASLQRGDGAVPLTNAVNMNKALANEWTKVSCVLTTKTTLPDKSGQVVYLSGMPTAKDNYLIIKNIKLEKGNVATDYSPSEADLEQKVAEYKQNADQNYASLQTTVQNLDGTVQHNKTVADQTAQGFSTRIESLETYKDGESERANAYFESAKTETAKQLTAERTAIANNYVAKSTYTSDVTGIRNELSATTSTANATKTNLANYQASNDKMVASLKSSLQTTDGNVSNLQTKVEAVPGQITSAVSSVESKIPKSVDTVNLIKNTDKPFAMGFGITNTTWNNDKKWAYLDLTDPNVNTAKASEIVPQGQFYTFKPTKGMTYTQSILIDTDATFNPNGTPRSTWFTSQGHNLKKGYFEKLSDTTYRFWSTCTWELEDIALRAFDWWDLHTVLDFRNSGTYLAFYKPKLTTGTLPSDWSPSPEDYDNAITQVKSEIKQTADGITLLATKTELNTAKSDLQSGINTATNKANSAQSTANSNAQTISAHTTQISALNTGLQAKVSQTDFNTLSGRVTTAENNITAKANELSSKITSVEGKIPSGEMNLVEYGRPANGYSPYAGAEYTTHPFYYNGAYKMYVIGNKATSEKTFDLNRFKVERNTEYTLYFKGFNNSAISHMDVWFLKRVSGSKNDWDSAQQLVGGRKLSISRAEDVSVTFNTGNYDEGYLRFDNNGTTNAGNDAALYFGDVSVKKGKSNNGWSPSLAELASSQDLKSTQSELKQTADGMTLLATKTELNSAKNELQSGINTATSKANSAQSTANSNAQTISAHTTQISALNTGLSAKVSQSDFNTLSGRVTTAENNITAKANELSSKITSVEGKIPSGEMNLVEYGRPANGYSPYAGAEYTTHPFYYNGAYKMYVIGNKATSEKTFGLNRFKVERNTEYTLYFKGFNNGNITNMDVWFLKRVSGSKNDYDSAQILVGARKLSNGAAENISVTFNTGNYDEGYLRFDNNGTTNAGNDAALYFGDVSVKKGRSNNGWSPSVAELASSQDLKNAQSEFKQTTDAIKASVTSLDKSTVKSSSLTINADGVVMKAGKSTTDVANAIGSYFAVNQNAINLFSDKINVKGNMIVSGAITSDKIASKSINTAHLNGKIITADVISSNAVTASAIKAGAVTTDKMSANSINGDRIAAGTLDAAKIKAGSITASQIASGTLTSAQIKAGAIKSINIEASAITSDKIAANSISSDKIVASGITANVIKGGVLKAANDAMQINLNSSNITFSEDASVIFTSSDNALKRVITGKPSQFIKMCDSVFVSEIGELPDSTLTVIGSNSDRTENIDSAGFGGMKIWNGSSSTDSTSFVELVGNRVAIYGNKNRSPWLFDMTTTTSSLIPQNSNGITHSLGRGDRPFHSVYADNMYIQGERVAMMLKDIALYIGYKGNNGWVDRIS